MLLQRDKNSIIAMPDHNKISISSFSSSMKSDKLDSPFLCSLKRKKKT